MIPNIGNTAVTVMTIVDAVFLLIAFVDYFLAYYGKNKKIYDFEIEKE